MDNVFSRSEAAQLFAQSAILAAKDAGWLDDGIMVDPAFAESEKSLMIAIMQELGRLGLQKQSGLDLSSEEISSMFTFVFGKAAEAVTNMYNNQPDKFELTGMLGGQIPVYAEDAITEKFKTSAFPAACAENYLNWNDANSTLTAASDPVLLLFEALKWCFRLSCGYAVSIVEKNHNK